MLTQAELERKVEVFTTNGKKLEAQAIISKVGYTPVKIDEHAEMLAAVRLGHSTVPAALQAQKQATTAEADAREAANKELVSLADTSRTVFGADEPTLTALGLTTLHTTVKGPDGKPIGSEAATLSKATAEVIKRWRAQADAATNLAPDKAALLSAAGWGADRLAATKVLVDAYASTDTAQKAAIRTYQQMSDKQTADIEALRAWYTTAAALCKRAIKDADPDNHQQLLELLEL